MASTTMDATDAFITLDWRGQIIFWNPAAERLFQYHRREAIGRNVSLVVPRAARRAHECGFAKLLDTGVGKHTGRPFAARARRKDCSEFPVELSVARWGREKEVFFTAIIRDITDRKHAEAAVEKSLRVLKHTLDQTVQALSAIAGQKDQYTAGHQKRVARLACAIAENLCLSAAAVETIRIGAVLHDIGKIQVPSEILTKPSRLTKTEFDLIMTHPGAGYEIVKEIPFRGLVATLILAQIHRLTPLNRRTSAVSPVSDHPI